MAANGTPKAAKHPVGAGEHCPPVRRISVPGSPPLIVAAVLALTALVYLPVLGAGFLNLDDYYYITKVRPFAWQQIAHVFTHPFEGYHPLTLVSFGFDYLYAGFTSWPYHLHNLLLHLLNTLLVFLLVRELFPGKAVVAAVTTVLFGVHPVHVEAVAWVTSRKDLLYALFFLAALVVYARYTQRPSPVRFVLCLGLFVLSAFAKGMAVSLPLSLLCIDYLCGRRLLRPRVLLEKAPFLAISLVFGLVSIWSQHVSGYVVDADRMRPLAERLALACQAFWRYVANTCVPVELAAFYPYPVTGAPGWTLVLPVLGVVAAAAALAGLVRRHRATAFAGLFFTVNIVLVLQIVPVANFIVANRYAYVASLGVCLLAGLWAESTTGRRRGAAWAGLACLVVALGISTRSLAATWDNSVALWTDTIRKQPRAAFALNMRGCAYNDRRQYDHAIADFDRAIVIDPELPRSYLNRGFAYYRLEDWDAALADYARAIAADPGRPQPYNNRGLVLHARGQFEPALADFTRAVELGGDSLQGYLYHNNQSMALRALGRYDAAIESATRALHLKPNFAGAYINRAKANAALGRVHSAIKDLGVAIQINGLDLQSRIYKAALEAESGHEAAARRTLTAAIKLGGNAVRQAATNEPALVGLLVGTADER